MPQPKNTDYSCNITINEKKETLTAPDLRWLNLEPFASLVKGPYVLINKHFKSPSVLKDGFKGGPKKHNFSPVVFTPQIETAKETRLITAEFSYANFQQTLFASVKKATLENDCAVIEKKEVTEVSTSSNVVLCK